MIIFKTMLYRTIRTFLISFFHGKFPNLIFLYSNLHLGFLSNFPCIHGLSCILLSSQQAKRKRGENNVKFNQDVGSQAWSHLHYNHYSYIKATKQLLFIFIQCYWAKSECMMQYLSMNFAMGQINYNAKKNST